MFAIEQSIPHYPGLARFWEYVAIAAFWEQAAAPTSITFTLETYSLEAVHEFYRSQGDTRQPATNVYVGARGGNGRNYREA